MLAVHGLNGVGCLPLHEFKCLKVALWEILLGLCHSKHATFNN